MKGLLLRAAAVLLLCAACAPHREVVVQRTSDKRAGGGYSINDFSAAVLSNDSALVNNAIKGGIDVNQKDLQGRYPLEQVFPFGNCEMARTLLEAGADPDRATSDGPTIYDLAMKTNNSALMAIFKAHQHEK